MNFKKLLFVLGLVLAIGAGSGGFYLYKLQTNPVKVYRIKQSLGQTIMPGTLITQSLVETDTVLQKDVPPDPISSNDLGKLYANRYLYPGDLLLRSKTTTKEFHVLSPNDRILSIKPTDPGLLGMLRPSDLVTVIVSGVAIENCQVIGVVDSNGLILSILPEFAKEQSTNSSILNIAGSASNQSGKGPDRVLILTNKDKADLIAKSPSQQVSVIFEGRDSQKGGTQ